MPQVSGQSCGQTALTTVNSRSIWHFPHKLPIRYRMLPLKGELPL
jgi:hypothetical protein